MLLGLCVAAVILGGAAAGLFKPLDDLLQSFRFQLLQHEPTHEIVFLEIDAKSLQKVGVWPWPRRVEAEVVDRLMALNVRSAALDIDFSAASTPPDDAAFATALRRAGGFVSLAAFEQRAGAGEGRVANVPLAAFAAVSPVVSVSVPIGAGGFVRDYPYGLHIGDRSVPSLATALWRPLPGEAGDFGTGFGIDFGIDLKAIDRISVADLLAGQVDAARVEGRDVVVGSSAEELRDFFLTPRFGMISGGLVHILAAETLKQGLAMQDVPFAAIALAVLLLAGLGAAFDRRLSGSRPLLGAAALCLAIELGALGLQRFWALRVETASIQIALASFVLIAVISDLRHRRRQQARAERQRNETRAMLNQVIADNFDGVIVVDDRRRIVAASRLARDLLGRDLSGPMPAGALPGALNEALDKALAGDDRQVTTGEIVIAGDYGVARTIEYVLTGSRIESEDGRKVACLTFRDITQRRAQEARLSYLASNDSLTGAWTRDEFVRQLQSFHSLRGGPTCGAALISIDLRRFNQVNEAFGHLVGDQMLKAVVARLRSAGLTMVARLGGDNFAVAAHNASDATAVAELCRRLIQRLREPYSIGDHKVVIGVSLGAATTQDQSFSPDKLLTQANIAESAAKKLSANSFALYSPAMEDELNDKLSMEAALRRAIAAGELSLNYQPQFHLASGRLLGAEALMRWRHPQQGMISPVKFIPLAEETGLIVDLGRWALQTACRDAAEWPRHLRVAVNVSPIQFEATDMVAEIAGALQREGLAPSQLEIEITEGVFISGEAEIPAALERIRELGVSVALDDFGTGYSSLSYLGRMPIDKVKIDRSFVQNLAEGGEPEAIIQAILTLSQRLGKTVLAEGAETSEQARALSRMGCDAVQGFYFGRPTSLEAFQALVAADAAHSVIAKAS